MDIWSNSSSCALEHKYNELTIDRDLNGPSTGPHLRRSVRMQMQSCKWYNCKRAAKYILDVHQFGRWMVSLWKGVWSSQLTQKCTSNCETPSALPCIRWPVDTFLIRGNLIEAIDVGSRRKWSTSNIFLAVGRQMNAWCRDFLGPMMKNPRPLLSMPSSSRRSLLLSVVNTSCVGLAKYRPLFVH